MRSSASRWWRRLAYPSLLVIVVLLALVPVIGRDFNGNKNWISIGGGFLLQPSEFAKLALVVWGADLLARKRKVLGQWKHLLVPLVPVAGLIIALVLAGHDLGTAMILGPSRGAALLCGCAGAAVHRSRAACRSRCGLADLVARNAHRPRHWISHAGRIRWPAAIRR